MDSTKHIKDTISHLFHINGIGDKDARIMSDLLIDIINIIGKLDKNTQKNFEQSGGLSTIISLLLKIKSIYDSEKVPDLEPCPRCHSEVSMIKDVDDGTFKPFIAVECACGISMRHYGKDKNRVLILTEKWNQRFEKWEKLFK